MRFQRKVSRICLHVAKLATLVKVFEKIKPENLANLQKKPCVNGFKKMQKKQSCKSRT